MIPDFKTYIKESHWSEMNRRSQGIAIRREDDVNLLDFEGLFNYILKNYEISDDDYIDFLKTEETQKPYCIYLLVTDLYAGYVQLEYTLKPRSDVKQVIMSRSIQTDSRLERFFNALKEKYEIYDTTDYSGHYQKFGIAPKDGSKPDNKFFLDVLDFSIDFNPNNSRTIEKKKKI
jgi:hypothetical protein